MADYKMAMLGIVDPEAAKRMITFAHSMLVNDQERMRKSTADLDLVLDEYMKHVLEKKGE